MNQIAFIILKLVVSVAVVLTTTYLIPYLNEKIKKSKYEKLINWTEAGIKAAETTFVTAKAGGQKKEFVENIIKKLVKKYGLKISDEQINILIESILLDLKGGIKWRK